MNAADVELARMVYLASSLGVLLFTSFILRGLWRPLRFLLLAWTISLMFTPFFVQQEMPDGSQQNIVPAFVVMVHDAASDRTQWKTQIERAGKPIAAVGAITSLFALLLAFLLPKPAKPAAQPEAEPQKKKQKQNPYLPDDFQPE